jgi:anion transporter
MNVTSAIPAGRSGQPDLSLNRIAYIVGCAGIAAGFAVLVWLGLPEATPAMRIAFIVFGLATLGWVATKIGDSYIAIAAAVVLVLTNVKAPEALFATLGHELVWLLVASFVVAAAFKACGLSDRLMRLVVARVGTVQRLFYGLTAAIFATAYFIPSTSGRAALLLPVALALAKAIDNPRIVKALMLLFPTAILLSAMGSFIGAGAHLIAADIVGQITGRHIGFFEWMAVGAPFALASCFASTFAILHLFLSREERRAPFVAGLDSPKAGSGQGYVLGVIGALVLLWATEPLHGLNNTLVAVMGALAVTAPKYGSLSLKDGIKSVEWNLILFLAATLAMGNALIATGGAQWAADRFFSGFAAAAAGAPVLLIGVVTAIALFSHLLISSRSARASVLVPVVVMFAVSVGLDPLAPTMLTVAATGYCLTLTVSAKPVAIFQNLETPSYGAGDLLRLSAVLLPFHFLLLMAFAFFVWPVLGLNAGAPAPAAAAAAPAPSFAKAGLEVAAGGTTASTKAALPASTEVVQSGLLPEMARALGIESIVAEMPESSAATPSTALRGSKNR